MDWRYKVAKLLLGWANKVDPKRKVHCSPTENYIFRRQWTAEPYGIKDGIVVPRGETIQFEGTACELLHDIRVLMESQK
jgi:hypothetical protein